MDSTRPGTRDRVSLIAGSVGVAGSALVFWTTTHGREGTAAWEYVVRLAVFACVIVAVALFPNRRPSAYLLIFGAFVVFAGYLFPRISWFYYGDTTRAQDDSFYTHLYILMFPAMILTITAAYRLGGGSAGRCIKLAGTGVLILFSGFLDLMWFVVNPVDIPDRIDAPHINAITGGPIGYGATIVFALLHLPFVIGLNLLPLDRWIDRLLGPEAAPGEPRESAPTADAAR